MSPTDPQFDAWLDSQLRNVPVPAGLGDLLRQAALSDDEILDAALGAVPVPEGLEDRLRAVVLAPDSELDTALRTVPMPPDLIDRLQRVPGQHGWRRLATWSTAASFWIALGLSCMGLIMLMVMLSQPGATSKVAEPAAQDFALVLPENEPSLPEFVPVPPAWPDNPTPPDREVVDYPPPKIELERMEPSSAGIAQKRQEIPVANRDAMLTPKEGAWGGVLSIHREFDLPELKKATGLIPRGIDPPLVPEFDWAFFGRFRVHPFVWPARNPQLQYSVVPLAVDDASYELTRRYLEDRELPPREAIRTEEFLAALDYGWPMPKGAPVGVSTAAGPSPFAGPGFQLLQIGLQAADVVPGSRPPVNLVLAIDVSTSMRWGGRLEMTRRALEKFTAKLDGRDRLSIVVFSEGAEVLVEDAPARDLGPILRAVKALEVQGSTNLGAGLRSAYGLAEQQAVEHQAPVGIVLLTDGLTALAPDSARQIRQRLNEAAQRRIRLHVIDMAQEEGKGVDPQLADFAEAGAGRIFHAATAEEVRWALLELVTGKSQILAADVQLKVVFNPKTVLAYRLLGHEARAMAGLLPAHPEADFHAGQSATALYEVCLLTTGGNDVATVEVTWREPGGEGREHRAAQKVERRQFAATLLQAPLSLQAASVAAETAEILRDSPFARSRRSGGSLARVLELAAQLDTRVRQQPSFVEFLSVVERAAGMRTHRTRGGR